MRHLILKCDKCKEEVKPRHGESAPSVLTFTINSLALDFCPGCAKLLAEFIGVEVHVLYRKDL